MLDMPIPYSDELLYSTIARAGIHQGIVSPKELLDEVFGNRKIVATLDLPSHLDVVASRYPKSLRISGEALAYKHTLFPLYAPFVTEDRRNTTLRSLCVGSRGAVHLVLGIAASRIRHTKNIRYCPSCIKRQLFEYGEYYWLRRWQVVGADSCLDHGALVYAKVPPHTIHRHQFFPAIPQYCLLSKQQSTSVQSDSVTSKVVELLNLKSHSSATFGQWTQYYSNLIQDLGLSRGQNIDYEKIKPIIIDRWSPGWLQSMGLAVTDSQSCWLRSLLRKHRKSFSYLEHIVALEALLQKGWSFDRVLESVRTLQVSGVRKHIHESFEDFGLVVRDAYRNRWLSRVISEGAKHSRKHGAGADYAWLYRHDRNWLLTVNKRYMVENITINHRVDWSMRDRQIVRRLCRIRDEYEEQLESPRWSRNWYLSKLDHSTTVEKKLDKLPLVKLFFDRYCEDIFEYQIRRITNVVLTMIESDQMVKRWKVLRKAGLSEIRLKAHSRWFLEYVLRDVCKTTDLNIYTMTFVLWG